MTDPQLLWQQLRQAGLVNAAMPIHTDEQQPAFFIRMLLGASGWLAALFFASFIAAFFVRFLVDASQVWWLGIVLCGLSLGLSRKRHSNVFIQQFIFACSLAGQGLIIFGIFVNSHNPQISALLIIALELLLFVAMGIHHQRSTSIFIACSALVWLLGEQAWLYALPLFSAATLGLWLNRIRLNRYAAYVQPAATGFTLALWLTIALILVVSSTDVTSWYVTPSSWQRQLWITAGLSSLVCLAFAWQLIQSHVQQRPLRILALIVSLGVALLNLKMPGLAALCLLLCIGVADAHTRLTWLSLCCLAAYLMLYYYSLNDTLLYKSIVLCVSGAVLFVLYGVLNRYAQRLTLEQHHAA
ncbi:MAG TPA: DUF4401 domain-containing protein [Thiopseudomonas sp.]|nr:DUF4401 domain-containing protein [Thiopseudomonas sp.]